MRSILVLVVHVLLSLSAFAQQEAAQCTQFKTGLFAYRDDSLNAILIKRTPKKQVETNKTTGVVTKFRISWVSSCTYELKQIWSSSKAIRKFNGGTRTVIITSAGKDKYEYTCGCKDAEDIKKYSGIVYRVQ